MSQPYKLALPPPEGALTVLTHDTVAATVAYSRQSPRRRVIQPFHQTSEDTLHRMLNAVQPDSYIRPHRHLDPPKAEAWIVLSGSLAFFTFEDDGRVRDCMRLAACSHLAADSAAFGVDLIAGVYHSFIALSPDTVIYEVKPGPYAPTTDKAFAPWAPAENDPAAPAYAAGLLREFERRTSR